MKKLLIVLFVLVAAFIGIWTYKLKSPMAPNDNGVTDESTPWWERTAEGEAPTPDEEWVLDPEIPENYIPVLNGDELYMVIDNDGHIEKYRQRHQLEDGTWVWEDVDPNIPDNYEPVEGMENIYKVVGEDGSVQYLKYTRNSDDTYFFTEVDENGNPLVDDTPQGTEIPKNYVHVSDNIYAVYNEYGVLTGYKERYVDEAGNYAWRDCEAPPAQQEDSSGGNSFVGGGLPNVGGDNSGGDNAGSNNTGGNGGGDVYIINNGGGNGSSGNEGYVETETQTENVRTEDGWTIVYETVITKTYDRSGNLVSTKKDGPTEVNRFPTTSVNEGIVPTSSRIEKNMNDEKIRITNGLTFDETMESEVFALLNAQRAKNSLSPLSMSSGDLDTLAQLKAADMAVNGTTGANSTLYGTVSELCSRFNIDGTALAESEWLCVNTKSADNIHSKFQANQTSFDKRMSSDISEIAIAIVNSNGYYYICELYA